MRKHTSSCHQSVEIITKTSQLCIVFIFWFLLKTAKNILISYLNIISDRIFNMHSMYKQDMWGGQIINTLSKTQVSVSALGGAATQWDAFHCFQCATQNSASLSFLWTPLHLPVPHTRLLLGFSTLLIHIGLHHRSTFWEELQQCPNNQISSIKKIKMYQS